jgi:hypothetical protein
LSSRMAQNQWDETRRVADSVAAAEENLGDEDW